MRFLSFTGLAILTFWAASAPGQAAPATADVHFVHAVPGVGTADLEIDGKSVGSAGFGDVTGSVAVPAGPADLELTAPGGVTVTGSDDFIAGKSYTLVALAKGEGAELVAFEDGSATASKARIRMIHGAPELGEPNLLLNGKTIAENVQFTDATDYWTLEPGDYELVVEDPETGEPILTKQVSLAAGSSQTALVVGSAGEETDVVLAQDDVSAPEAAPQTGIMAPAAGGPSWVLSLIAGALAGACFFAGSRRFAGNASS